MQDPAVVTSPTKEITGAPPLQLSVAVTWLMSEGGKSEAHWNVTFGGQVIWGGVSSNTRMLCVHVAELPHSSVAR